MSISSDEVNFLVYRYLQENGFAHAAFTFAYESLVVKSSAAQTEIPPGALITFLQKGLEYIAIEEHISEDGTIQEFENNYSLLSPLICEAIAVKEDRRMRRSVPSSNHIAPSDAMHTSDAVAMEDGVLREQESKRPVPSVVTVIGEENNKSLHLQGHQGEVFMCVWSPGRAQLASGSADGVCRLWGLHALSADSWAADGDITLPTAIMPHASVEGEKYKDVTSVSWSPDGSYLATGCYDGMARIWTAQGELVKKLQEHTGPVFSLKWSKSGAYILSGSYDRRAIIWSAETASIIRQYLLHDGPVLDVDWKDSDTFATCSSDKAIYICQVSHPDASLKVFRQHQDEVNAVCWSPGGQLLASCSDDSTAKIYTIDGLKHDLRGHSKEIFTLRWTPTGPHASTGSNALLPLYLCTASFDGTVKVWNADSGDQVFSLSKHLEPVYSLAPSPNGLLLASGSLGGNVSIWSLASGTLLREFQAEGDTFDVSWSCDGRLLCSCFSSGKVLVLPVAAELHANQQQSQQTMQQQEQDAAATAEMEMDLALDSIIP